MHATVFDVLSGSRSIRIREHRGTLNAQRLPAIFFRHGSTVLAKIRLDVRREPAHPAPRKHRDERRPRHVVQVIFRRPNAPREDNDVGATGSVVQNVDNTRQVIANRLVVVDE